MSQILNSIIAGSFAQQNRAPSPATTFVNARNNRQIIDGQLESQQSMNSLRDTQTSALDQAMADEAQSKQTLAQILALDQQMAQAQQAVPGMLQNFEQSASRGALPDFQTHFGPDGQTLGPGVNPDLAGQAVQMIQQGFEKMDGRKQELMYKLAQTNPAVRDAMISQLMGGGQKFQTLTDDQEAQMGLDPSGSYQIGPDGKISQINKAGTNVTTNVNTPKPPAQELAEDKAFGASLVEDYNAVRDAANGAQENIQRLRLQAAIPVDTGSLEGLKAGIGALAEGIGIPVDADFLSQVSSVQKFNAVAGDLLATKLATQKGPQTDDDARRMKETIAQITNTESAKDFIIRSSVAMESRKVEMEEFARLHKERTGSFAGWRTEWASFKRKTPMFGINPNTKQPVFYTEFMEAVANANPGATRDELLTLWRTKYGPG